MPIKKISPRIPIILTKPDGTQQRYWTTLENFMKSRDKGMKIKRIPRKKHESVRHPKEPAEDYEMEFIENFMDFGEAGLKIAEDMFTAELNATVTIKKNGNVVNTYNVKIDKENLARAILEKIMGLE